MRASDYVSESGFARRMISIVLAVSFLSSLLVLMAPAMSSHLGNEIYSEWAFSTPAIDGQIGSGEWDDAVILDLSTVPGTTMGTFMYVMNDATNLYMAYDAVGDTRMDAMDGCCFAFDTDHNGLETDQHDDQFIVGDLFGITAGDNQAHYVYDQPSTGWVVKSQPFSEPGLLGGWDFGSSPNDASDHRMYEIAIPLSLLTVSAGDTIGFASHGFMGEGVIDWFMFLRAGWPACPFGPQPLNEYGDIILDTAPAANGLRILPRVAEQFGVAAHDVDYTLTIKNKGISGPDSFDLEAVSSPGTWPMAFYDSTGTIPLVDTNGDPGALPDTGNLNTGESVDIILRVSVPGGALPGETDNATITATSFGDPLVNDTSMANTTVARPILLVDDDANINSELWYINSLASLGYAYDLWNTSSMGSPDIDVLNTHLAVIWFTGNDAWGQSTLSSQDRQNLGDYLDNGGKLFMNSDGLGQDAWQNFDDWYEEYFDVKHDNNLFSGATVYSKPGNPVSGGMLPFRTHEGDYCTALNGGFDFMVPILMAQPSFNITNPGINDTGITLDHYAYRLVYNSFDLADVNTSSARDDIMNRTLSWLLPSNGVSVFPHQMGYGDPGTVVNYTLTVKNIGSIADSFDLGAAGLPFGWTVEFYDAANAIPLVNNNGNPAPDTNIIAPYDTFTLTVRVTINGLALPGDTETSMITATPFLAPAEARSVPLETQVQGDILLVDDDKYINSENWYINSLVNLGYTYNIWNRTLYGVPPLSVLQDHDAVIWFTGNTDGNHWGNYKTLYPEDRAVLGDYMDGGGSVYLSSAQSGNDAYWSPEPWQSWYNDYLGADFLGSWVGQQGQIGQPGNPVGDSLMLDTHVGDYCPDLMGAVNTFNALPSADPAFELAASPGDFTANTIDAGSHRLVFSSFDFADVNDTATRDVLMWRILNWLCPVDGVSIYDDQEGFGQPGTEVNYTLTVRNIGSSTDTFDLNYLPGFQNALVSFYDSTNTVLLTDTNGDPLTLPDTGPVNPGGFINITVRVYIAVAWMLGYQEVTMVTANSTNNPALGDSAELVTTVPYAAPFFDDMEGTGQVGQPGFADWTAEGLWHRVNNESGAAPAWNLSYSGDWSWWYGQDLTGDHDTGGWNYGMLASPAINLANVSYAGMGFEEWYDGDTWANIRQVKISVDGGDWQSVDTLDNNGVNQIWKHHSTDLSAYVGHVVRIAIWFDLGQFGFGGFQGWYIDDFTVDITPPQPPVNTTASLSPIEYLAQEDYSWSGVMTNDYTYTWASDDQYQEQAEGNSYLGTFVPQAEPAVTDGLLVGGTVADVQTSNSVYQRWQEVNIGAGARSLDLFYNCTMSQHVWGVFDLRMRGGWYFDTGDATDYISIWVYNFTSGAFDDTGVDMSKGSISWRYVYNLDADHYLQPGTETVRIRFKDDFQGATEDTGTLYLDYVAASVYSSRGWHTWRFDVYAGSEPETWTFNVEGHNTANTVNEGWLFEYSFDAVTFFQFPTNITYNATDTVDTIKSSVMPAPGSGNLYIRATDTDRGWGNESSEPLFVDRLWLVPTGLKGQRMGDVNVSWSPSSSPDTASYNIYRGTSIDGPFVSLAEGITPLYYQDHDAGDQNPNDYFYIVRAVDSTGMEDVSASPYMAAKVVRAVNPGWNLLSVNVDMADTALGTVLQTGNWNYARTYDAFDVADPWKGNHTLKPFSLNDLNALDYTAGIWVNMSTADNLTFAGMVRTTTNINLKAGWNLVGYPTFNTTRTVTDALMGVPYDMVDTYDGAAPYLISGMLGTDIMSPEEAYWVHVTADSVWTVDA